MNMSTDEILYRFIDAFEQGQILKAMQLILSSPDVCYDDLVASEHPVRYVINYVDACVFKGVFDAYKANLVLQNELKKNERLQLIATVFLEILKWDEIFLQEFMNQENIEEAMNVAKIALKGLSELQIAAFLQQIPTVYFHSLQNKPECLKNLNKFQQAKSLFYELICEKNESMWHFPWHFFSYTFTPQPISKAKENEVPLIFLEPIEGFNYQEYFKDFLKGKAVFVFETKEAFFQFFQFPELISILSQPQHLIYILDLYPQQQLQTQNEWKQGLVSLSFSPVSMRPHMSDLELLPRALEKVFSEWLEGNAEKIENETESANHLYRLGKKILFAKEAFRLGKSRLMALKIKDGYERFVDRHKGSVSVVEDLETSRSYYKQLIEQVSKGKKSRSPKLLQAKNTIHIAHIVAQLVDGEHPLTRLLRQIIAHTDLQQFKVTVISTERLVTRPLEYPFVNYLSEASRLRGKETIEAFEKRGVQVALVEADATYGETVDKTIDLLDKLQVDIAVFHGPDEVNTLSSYFSDVPIRVLFEHGFWPAFPAFDFTILSSEEAYQKACRDNLLQGMESYVLGFCVDAKAQWQGEPFSKKELAVPDDSVILTTISNHLDSRLSVQMCQAIGEILQRCPQAYYMPIGAVHNPEKLRTRFEAYGVNERVIFLGSRPNPSQYARSMHLYLNEFPFGSGLAILDAMAAGCPVVSMYDPEGPLQASYAGTYFGQEWVIKSCKKEEYVDLACRLIQDPLLYQKWSEQATKQYEVHADVAAYTKAFAKQLLSLTKKYQKSL